MKTKDRGRKKQRRSPRPLKRLIHIGDQVWSYRISGLAVIIRWPDNLTHTRVLLDEFTGLSWNSLERMEWKGNGVQIGPFDVKKHIQEKILGVPSERRFNGTLFMVDKATGERFSPIGVRIKQGKLVDSSEHWMVNTRLTDLPEDPIERLKKGWPQWDYDLRMDGGDAYYADLKRSLGLKCERCPHDRHLPKLCDELSCGCGVPTPMTHRD